MNGILAQTIDRQVYLKSMHEQFSRANPDIWWEILLGAVIVAGVVGLVWAVWFWQRWQGDPSEVRPMRLYRQVLARLGFTAGDVWRLKRLAGVVGMSNPTAVLISAELYDEAVERYCASRGLFGTRKGTAVQFKAIRARLFSE